MAEIRKVVLGDVDVGALQMEVESLREQLEAKAERLTTTQELYLAEQARAEHAEAKLAEEKELRAGTEAAFQDYDKWLGDALDALGVKTVFEIKGAKDRLVEVGKVTDEDVERVAHAIEDAYLNTTDRFDAFNEFRAAARAALSAYLEPTTKGDT